MVFSNENPNGALEVTSNDHSKSDGTSEKSKAWEHPWTTNEIRKNSSNWTLAGDVGLLNHLKQFSHKLISRTHEMEKVMDSLVHKSKVASAKVNNVINDFQMLSNLQFVENRVYDEEASDVTPAQTPDALQQKTKEQREAEMVPRITLALKLGVSVLDKAFERIDVEETSDSEDEDELSHGRTVLEPKDLYEHRPLPFIIGSKEFEGDDLAGLHYMNEEDVSTDFSTQDENISASEESEIESDEESDEEILPQESVLVREHKETKSSIDTLRPRYSDSESSDLFEGENEENGYSSDPLAEAKPPEAAPSSLIEELKRKTKPSVSQEQVVKPQSIQQPIPSSVVKKADDDLFNDGFAEEEEDSPFQKKTGLFSSDKLFAPTKEEKQEGGLFDDDEDILPTTKKEISKSAVPKPTQSKAVPAKKEVPSVKSEEDESDLFGDDEEDSEYDLFSITKPAKPPAKKESKPAIVKQDTKKIEPKSEPSLFEDSDNFDLFGSNANAQTAPVKSTVKQPQTVAAPKPQVQNQSSALPISSKPEKKPFSLPEKKESSNSLFGDDSDDNDLFSAAVKPNEKKFDFSSREKDVEDDDDDLFSAKSSTKVVKKEPKSTIATKKTKKTEPKSEPNLFEDGDNFDLFGSQTKAEAAPVKSNLPPMTKTKTASEIAKSEEKKVLSLFEDSDNFDLFGPPKKVPEKPAVTVEKVVANIPKEETAASSNIFDDKPPSLHKPVAATSATAKKVQMTVPTVTKPVTKAQSNLFENDSASGFDNPVSVPSMLTAINKDRVKVQTKRRKPTRKGRQSRLDAPDSSEEPNAAAKPDATEEPPAISKSTPVLSSKPSATTTKPESEVVVAPEPQQPPRAAHKIAEQSKKNLMSQLMSEASSSRIGKKTAVPSLETNDNEDDDLFSNIGGGSKMFGSEFSFVSPTSTKPSIVPTKENVDANKSEERKSSILLSDSTSDDDLFSTRAFSDFRGSISEKNSGFDDDDDDDIFKSVKTKDSASKSSLDNLTDGDDDIFAGVDKEKYEMFPTQQYDDEDDDDDIFSNLEKSSAPSVSQSKQVDVKKDEKDDLFSDPLGGLALND